MVLKENQLGTLEKKSFYAETAKVSHILALKGITYEKFKFAKNFISGDNYSIVYALQLHVVSKILWSWMKVLEKYCRVTF